MQEEIRQAKIQTVKFASLFAQKHFILSQIVRQIILKWVENPYLSGTNIVLCLILILKHQ